MMMKRLLSLIATIVATFVAAAGAAQVGIDPRGAQELSQPESGRGNVILLTATGRVGSSALQDLLRLHERDGELAILGEVLKGFSLGLDLLTQLHRSSARRPRRNHSSRRKIARRRLPKWRCNRREIGASGHP